MSAAILFKRNYSLFRSILKKYTDKLDGTCEVKLPESWKIEKCQASPTAPLSMTGVSQKGKPRSKKLNVYIHGYVNISGKIEDRVLISGYGTKLLYCKPKSASDMKNVDVSGGFHFDFSDTTEPAHPIFHMQQDNTILQEEVTISCRVQIDSKPQDENRTFRIPTSQMDIFSALIMIIADNFVDKSSEEQCQYFIDMIRELEKYMLIADLRENISAYGGYLTQVANLTPISWYCERSLTA